jgi:F0F1-type ATP synthase membrane subunit c/vacuolar-type H+-ATPase subunit K
LSQGSNALAARTNKKEAHKSPQARRSCSFIPAAAPAAIAYRKAASPTARSGDRLLAADATQREFTHTGCSHVFCRARSVAAPSRGLSQAWRASGGSLSQASRRRTAATHCCGQGRASLPLATKSYVIVTAMIVAMVITAMVIGFFRRGSGSRSLPRHLHGPDRCREAPQGCRLC